MKLVFGSDPGDILVGQNVAIDTETTGIDWNSKLLGLSMAWEDEGIRSCYLTPDSTDRLFDDGGKKISNRIIEFLFQNNNIIFHNIGFDYRVLYKEFGVQPPVFGNDTMHISKMYEYQESFSLENLYKKYIGEPPEFWVAVKSQRKNLVKLDQKAVYEYGAFDAVATLLIYNKLFVEGDLYTKDVEFTNLVMKMISRGVPVDREYIAFKKTEFSERMVNIVKELIPSGILNPNSSIQVGNYIKSIGASVKTETGRIKTDEETLEKYSDVKEVQSIIKYRQLSKAVSSWFDDLEMMSKDDGMAHSILNPFGTRSFRMSSSSINMQGIPMKDRKNAFGSRAFGDLSGIFKSKRPNEKIWQIDIKQAEFRMAAMLANENNLAEVFSSGDDPYTQMAIKTWNDKNRRQDAKRAALAAIYETGVNTFALNNKITVEESKEILYSFRNRFPKLKEASRFYEQFVIDNGYVNLMDGHKVFFGPKDETYKSFNQRVQGSVAVAMWPSMLKVENEFPDRLILQIHDSLIMYLPTNELEKSQMVERIRQIILESVPEKIYAMVTPKIPYIVDLEQWE